MKGIIIDLKDITDSREVMESKESPKISWFIYIMLAVIITAIIFACVFRIDEYSRVSGEIKTQTAASSVISTNSCKLKEILVSEGQEIKAGDVLFVLDSDYAESQKEILEEKLNGYKSDLSNTELLKESIEKNKNLFKNTLDDSKFYHRYEQYKNGVLLTAQEIDSSILSSSLSKEEKENNLTATNKAITDTKSQLSEYENVLSCVENGEEYSGSDAIAQASFDEYNTSYSKANRLCEQYMNALEKVEAAYNEQSSQEKITAEQIENINLLTESAYTAVNEYKEAYLEDLRSQILLIENQLITDDENPELLNAISEYKKLKTAIEQDTDFVSDNKTVNDSFSQYRIQYDILTADYSAKSEEYQNLYSKYMEQTKTTPNFWYHFGGVFFNLLTTVICICMVLCSKNVIANVGISVLAAISLITGIGSDGYNLIIFRKSAIDRIANYKIMLINSLQYQGIKLENMPKEIITFTKEEKACEFGMALSVIEANILMNQYDFKSAEIIYRSIVENEDAYAVYQNECKCELMFCMIMNGYSTMEINEIYNDIKQYVITTGKTYIMRKRLMYAYHLIIEKNQEKATKEYNLAVQMKNTYPAKGEYLSEMCLIGYIKENCIKSM